MASNNVIVSVGLLRSLWLLKLNFWSLGGSKFYKNWGNAYQKKDQALKNMRKQLKCESAFIMMLEVTFCGILCSASGNCVRYISSIFIGAVMNWMASIGLVLCAYVCMLVCTLVCVHAFVCNWCNITCCFTCHAQWMKLCVMSLKLYSEYLHFCETFTFLSLYEGCSKSKERLRIQPAQLFPCTRSVIWCVQ